MQHLQHFLLVTNKPDRPSCYHMKAHEIAVVHNLVQDHRSLAVTVAVLGKHLQLTVEASTMDQLAGGLLLLGQLEHPFAPPQSSVLVSSAIPYVPSNPLMTRV